MQLAPQLIDIEQKLWTNDPVLYRNSFIEEALLIFPETGMITRDAAIDAILMENVENRRWAEVQFSAVRSLRLADNVILLTYKAAARWAHEESPNLVFASSVYVERDGAWKLAFHQQTPLDAA